MGLFSRPKIIDSQQELELLKKLLNREKPYDLVFEKTICQQVRIEANKLSTSLSNYLEKEELFIHHKREEALRKVIRQVHELKNRANYYMHHGKADFSLLKRVYESMCSAFDDYAQMSGPAYLFRHCDRQIIREKHSGWKYYGITPRGVREEATAAARLILEEVLISPYKVKIYVQWSEEYRTHLFFKLVKHWLRKTEDKVEYVEEGYDTRLRYGIFSKKAMAELRPHLKQQRKNHGKEKGTWNILLEWYLREGPFTKYQHQPDPDHTAENTRRYLHDKESHLKEKNRYVMSLGFSHSFTIDSILLKVFPTLIHHQDKVIGTGAHCKAECGELGYLGAWKDY